MQLHLDLFYPAPVTPPELFLQAVPVTPPGPPPDAWPAPFTPPFPPPRTPLEAFGWRFGRLGGLRVAYIPEKSIECFRLPAIGRNASHDRKYPS